MRHNGPVELVRVCVCVCAGTIATRPGPMMAGVLSFEATVRGRGGHAAMPHTTVNPVIAAASIVVRGGGGGGRRGGREDGGTCGWGGGF